jgi:hypothetical protein
MPERATACGNALGKGELPCILPTRIITCAWGEKYVGELLSMTLPALLAPGNLPYVASMVPCELVILTEQGFFSRVLSDITVRKIRELCRVRLIEIDDLIPSPDRYGMAITYALHRGFRDLGPAATDTWLIFLNADFILADGSLRTLVRHLAEGKRLVASPSYCVKAEAVLPELLKRVDPRSRRLSIPPREMAALVLRHRHDTIRGKTVNQAVVSIRFMDQFYWLVDHNTMIGHQMPIAIVGMRPERNLPEPNSFWDYGLIKEFCPNFEHFVLGDSDDFLMMELRREHVLQEWLLTGWPEPSEIARNMILFVTAYSKDMARHPLTLHSSDLPPQVDEARVKLRAFIDRVFVHLPSVLPSHLEHPQFEYHWSSFMEARHKYLSTRIGTATETCEPPESLSELDKVWWRLDGLAKSHGRRRTELNDLAERQRWAIAAFSNQMEDAFQAKWAEIEQKLIRDLNAMVPKPRDNPVLVNRMVECCPGQAPPDDSDGQKDPWVATILDNAEEWISLERRVREKKESVQSTIEFIDRLYKDRLLELELEFESAREHLQSEYERLLKRRTRSASIPHVVTRHGPRPVANESADKNLLQIARRVHHKWYGKLPRVQPLHPYWAAMRHLIRIVDSAAANGATNVLVVIGSDCVADTIADQLPGLHAQVSFSELVEGNFNKAFKEPTKFDMCICTLGNSELHRFGDMVRAAAPHMNNNGKVLGFYPNFSLRPVSPDEIASLQNILDLPWPGLVYYAGSDASARVVRRFHAALSGRPKGRLARLVKGALMLLIVTPSAVGANRSEAAAPEERSLRLPEHCTSITIDITMSHP